MTIAMRSSSPLSAMFNAIGQMLLPMELDLSANKDRPSVFTHISEEHPMLIAEMEKLTSRIKESLLDTDLFSDIPDDQLADPDGELVSSFENWETICSTLKDNIARHERKTDKDQEAYQLLSGFFTIAIESLQHLRYEVLIRDGQLVPRSERTFSGGAAFMELLATSQETDYEHITS